MRTRVDRKVEKLSERDVERVRFGKNQTPPSNFLGSFFFAFAFSFSGSFNYQRRECKLSPEDLRNQLLWACIPIIELTC